MKEINSYNDSIQQHWLENELPGINCLVHGNGVVTLLNIYSVSSSTGKNHFLFPIADTTIASVEQYNDDIWTELQIHPNSIVLDNLIFICGEGGMGNEGFIASIEANNRKLQWALFSSESNPFIQLKMNENILEAYSTLMIYRVDINNPTNVEIIRME